MTQAHPQQHRCRTAPGQARGPFILAAALLLATLAVPVPSALAQEGGSTGGSIGGNIGGSTGGSIGGNITPSQPPSVTRPAPGRPAPQVRRPVYAPRPQQVVRREAPARREGGAFDGTWSIATASSCAGNGAGAFRVAGGRLTGRSARSSASGSVSAAGAVYSTERFNGMTSVYTGHLSGNSGSGTYQRADGCTGQWTASR